MPVKNVLVAAAESFRKFLRSIFLSEGFLEVIFQSFFVNPGFAI
jgi:hypothetical protein